MGSTQGALAARVMTGPLCLPERMGGHLATSYERDMIRDKAPKPEVGWWI
jgi:hypothetical protein